VRGNLLSKLDEKDVVYGVTEDWQMENDKCFFHLSFQRTSLKRSQFQFEDTRFNFVTTPYLTQGLVKGQLPAIIYAKIRSRLPDTFFTDDDKEDFIPF
tara:strand:- start:424 stop:717 length:294 start_codon:yes stop_codon:yes gene_type:complete